MAHQFFPARCVFVCAYLFLCETTKEQEIKESYKKENKKPLATQEVETEISNRICMLYFGFIARTGV